MTDVDEKKALRKLEGTDRERSNPYVVIANCAPLGASLILILCHVSERTVDHPNRGEARKKHPLD